MMALKYSPNLLKFQTKDNGILEVIGIAADTPECGFVSVKVRASLAEDGGSVCPQVACFGLAAETLDDRSQILNAHANGVVVVGVVGFSLYFGLE